MATIHVPAREELLRSLAMIASARGTTIREEVNEACKAHVERQAPVVMSAARQMVPDQAEADPCGSKSGAERED